MVSESEPTRPYIVGATMDHYTAEERAAHGKKLAKARAAAVEAVRVAQVLARSAHSEGVPETRIAADLGVDRMTVRTWVGKKSTAADGV